MNMGPFYVLRSESTNKARAYQWIFAFIYHRYLVDRDIRYSFILISEIKHAAFNINNVPAKRSIGAASHIDPFAKQLS